MCLFAVLTTGRGHENESTRLSPLAGTGAGEAAFGHKIGKLLVHGVFFGGHIQFDAAVTDSDDPVGADGQAAVPP